MSRHRFHVATSFLPTVGFPSRDTKNPGHDLPHCHPCRDLKMMSRPQIQLGQITTSNSQVATPKGHPTSRPQIHVATPFLLNQNKQGRDLKMRSRHQIHSVLLRRQNPRSPSLRPTATQLGRDATSWSRPHAQPNQVATSNRCRDLK